MNDTMYKFSMVIICSTLLAACGDSPQTKSTVLETPHHEVNDPNDPTQPTAGDEPEINPEEFAPVFAPPVEVSSGFEFFDIASPALSPAVAIAPDATPLTAFVDMMDGWPRVRVAHENEAPVVVPGRQNFMVAGEVTNGVSLVAARDSTFHMVFDIAGKILYSRIEVGARTHGAHVSDPVVVHDELARDASVAISATSEIVVAYTVDPSPDSPDSPVVMIARGEPSEDGAVFAEPVAVNPECCVDDFGEKRTPHAMSGPSLAIDAGGQAHVVYEWSVFGTTVIEYAHDDGATTVTQPIRVAEAAFSPCPALAIDDQGVAHVTYILEPQRNVWHVAIDDQETSERTSLYESDRFIYLALMKMDGSNQMHLAIKEADADSGEKLTYVAVDDGSQTQRIIAEQPDRGFFKLTSRTGGMVLVGDELYLPFERALDTEDHGYLELAIGR